jgi:3-phosphoshikimate 1-carboxyvinyltransferase
MMNVKIVKPIQGGTIQAVTSKSVAHRLLICAALAEEETFVSCPVRSEDIDATARCLEAMGAVVRYDKDGFRIMPVKMGSREWGVRSGDAKGCTRSVFLGKGSTAGRREMLNPRQMRDDVKPPNGGVKSLPIGKRPEGTYGFSLSSAPEGLEHILDCGESGSTLRFLLPVCGALGLRTSFNMKGRLPNRPLSGLYEEMQVHGCTLSAPGSSPLTCDGKL